MRTLKDTELAQSQNDTRHEQSRVSLVKAKNDSAVRMSFISESVRDEEELQLVNTAEPDELFSKETNKNSDLVA